MELISGNRRFELRVIGYQFPDLPDTAGKYDRNWLMIYCHTTIARGQWDFTEPFMLTWDVRRWSEWLRSIVSNTMIHPFETSYDSVVHLQFVGIIDKKYHLRVEYFQEGRPPWLQHRRKYSVSLFVTPDQLLAAADALEDDLRRFPPRGPNPFEQVHE